MMGRRRSFTLLEVVMAMSLLVVLSSMTYWFYSSSLDTRARGTEEARKLRLVRVLLDRIATEIRQATVLTTGDKVGIRGEAERIWLSTLRVPRKELSTQRSARQRPPAGEYDLVKVAYHIVRHPDIRHEDGYELALGLARVETRVPRPGGAEPCDGCAQEPPVEEQEPQEEEEAQFDAFVEALFKEEDKSTGVGAESEINWEELYAPEIRYLRFCYFDGNKWWDTWDIPGENPLPQLVMVTVGFEGCAPFGEEFGQTPNEEFCECLNRDPVDCERLAPDQYSSVVRVSQSDPLFRSRIVREITGLAQEMSVPTEGQGNEDGDGR